MKNRSPSLTLIISLVLASFVVIAVLRAWVICKLWGWYVVSAFSLPTISLSTAFGLSPLISMFVPPTLPNSEKREWSDLVGMFLGQVVGYLVVYVIGGWVKDISSVA